MDFEAQLDSICKNLEGAVGAYALKGDLTAARIMSDGLMALIAVRAKLALPAAPPALAEAPPVKRSRSKRDQDAR